MNKLTIELITIGLYCLGIYIFYLGCKWVLIKPKE